MTGHNDHFPLYICEFVYNAWFLYRSYLTMYTKVGQWTYELSKLFVSENLFLFWTNQKYHAISSEIRTDAHTCLQYQFLVRYFIIESFHEIQLRARDRVGFDLNFILHITPYLSTAGCVTWYGIMWSLAIGQQDWKTKVPPHMEVMEKPTGTEKKNKKILYNYQNIRTYSKINQLWALKLSESKNLHEEIIIYCGFLLFHRNRIDKNII